MSSNERTPLSVATVPLQGVHLIEASAGTGKTFTITSLVLRLVVERERPIESILAVTFTNAATAELKERVADRLATALSALSAGGSSHSDPVLAQLAALPRRDRVLRLLRRALANVDRAGIFTIHGFASKMLSEHALRTGARQDSELVGDQRAVVLDVTTDFWSKEIATLPLSVFRGLGGTGFFRTLLKVGLVRAGAPELPLTQPDTSLDLQEERDALRTAFLRARAAFEEQGEELCQLLLNSPALNRNTMRLGSLRSDFEAYRAFFVNDDPFCGHPATERFTHDKVQSSVKKGKTAPEHPLLLVLQDLKRKSERVELALAQFADMLRARLCEYIDAAVGLEHQRERTQSFDGLLRDLCDALQKKGQGKVLARSLASSYPVALIDEFQDTDPVQYEIFRRIYRQDAGETAPSLFLIGDPKQSIYAFRGADIFTYLRAANDAHAGVWTLSTSYRASPRLVQAQNALFRNPRTPFGLKGIAYEPLSVRPGAEDVLRDAQNEPLPGLRLLSCSGKEDEFLHVAAQEIARFLAADHRLGDRPVKPSDIAVLTRTNRQAQALQAHLLDLDIPAVMHGDRSVFEAPEAIELRRVLRALSEPNHRILRRTALATRIIGFSAHELDALEEDLPGLEKWMALLAKWSSLFKSRGVAHAMEALFSDVNLLPRTLKMRDGERRMTNLRHLLELLHEAETVEHLGVAGLLRWFEGAIADPSGHAMAAEARQLRLESDHEAITLTTAHKSKGLEYNIVFLPTIGMGDASFLDEAFRYFEEEQQASVLEVRGKLTRGDSEQVHRLEAAQESLRLGYVALTRAKHHVVALFAEPKKFSALAYFLFEPDLPGEGGLSMALEYLKKIPEATIQAALDRLQESSEGSCVVDAGDERWGPPYSRKEERVELVAPPVARSPSESERTSSFSRMVRSSSNSRATREGRDIDEGTELHAPAFPGVESSERTRSILADFPRGARPGDALHGLFEKCAFEDEVEAQKTVARDDLILRGFEAAHAEAAAQSLIDVLETPLPHVASENTNKRLLLRELSKDERVAEMEFGLPVGVTIGRSGQEGSFRLSASRLARALGANERAPHQPWEAVLDMDTYLEPMDSDPLVPSLHGTSLSLSPSYLRAVQNLDFEAWTGFLRGFIDLVYEFQGRIYALDYKSNHLGDFYDDYHPQALQHAMEEHHYLLQALIYCVAVHRYARSKIPDYDYERHFGGMQYLFLRGMAPDRTTGIQFLRPTVVMIESLDRLFFDPGSAHASDAFAHPEQAELQSDPYEDGVFDEF